MDRFNPPAATIQAGERVKLHCYDCFRNAYFKKNVADPTITYTNPCTGPVYVAGARAGDTLIVDIERIEMDEAGFVEAVPAEGPLGSYLTKKVVRQVTVKNKTVFFSDTISFPARPMIGVLGVAPKNDPVPTVDPGDHGGNLDCTSFCEGARILLPVFADGALLAAGDMHAAMGDGELGVSGLEIAGSCTLRVDLQRDIPIKGPVVLRDGAVEVLASERDLDEAARMATDRLFHLLIRYSDIEPTEASMIITMCADLSVCQMVNSMATVKVRMPCNGIPNLRLPF